MSEKSDDDNYKFVHYLELPWFGIIEQIVAAKAGIGEEQEDLIRVADELKLLKLKNESIWNINSNLFLSKMQ